jgi:hypothetical protein
MLSSMDGEQAKRWQGRMGLHTVKRTKPSVAMVRRSTVPAMGKAQSGGRMNALVLREEANEAQAGDALDWSALGGRPCTCEGLRLHLPPHVCKADVQWQLGQGRKPCEEPGCRHLEEGELRRRVLQWWGQDWRPTTLTAHPDNGAP